VTCERSFFEIEILEIKKTGVGAEPASKSATISEPSVDAERAARQFRDRPNLGYFPLASRCYFLAISGQEDCGITDG